MKNLKNVLKKLRQLNLKELNESPYAISDNFEDISEEIKIIFIAPIRYTKMNTCFIELEIPDISEISDLVKLNNLQVYITKLSETYQRVIIGKWQLFDSPTNPDYGAFEVLGVLEIDYINKLYNLYDDPVIKTSLVYVQDEEYRGIGLATALYLTLLYNNYTLLSDFIQFDNARKLWISLSTIFNNITVDVIDINTKTILKTKHRIKNTEIDNLDEEWSIDSSKSNIRFVARLEK